MKTLYKALIFFLFASINFIGCRQIFGDRTETESIVQAPVDGTNILVLEPVQGKIWNPGDTIPIKWTAPTIREIDIQLYRKTEFKFIIAEKLDNYGKFDWIVPLSISLSNHYIVKIMNHNNNDVFELSGRFGIQ